MALAYDNRGNAVRIANPHLIEHYIYDHANRVITLERKLKDSSLRQKLANKVWPGDQASQVFSFNYTYNDAGMVTEMVYPDGQMHSFSYDSQLNRLQKIGHGPDSASQADFINSLSYNKAGVVTEMSYANGTSQNWQFDNRKRIKEIQIKKGVDTLTQMKYTLNGVGDIVGINLNEYTYDGFDRLISAQTQFPGTVDRFKLVIAHFGTYKNGSPLADGRVYNPDADLDKDGRINGEDHITASYDNERDVYDFEDFEYDRNGNRTKLVQNGDEYQYTYGPRNRLETIKLKKEGSKLLEDFAKYEYDANGNTIKRMIYGESGTSVIEFEYDTLNRLVKTKKNGSEITEYFYDNAGNRLIKKTAGQTTLYLRHGQIAVAMDLEVYESDPDNKGLINRYVLSGDLLAGRVTTTIKNDSSRVTENFYYHLDHLNSTKCVTKQDGTVEVLYEYRAFGEQLKRLDKDGNDTTDKAKYSYSQKELDEETNLMYFNARYYDATIGRFINVDPLNDGQNWYVYCSNNPMCFVDPTGLEDENLNLDPDPAVDNPTSEGHTPDILIIIGRQSDSYKSLENKESDNKWSTKNTSLDSMYIYNKNTGEDLFFQNIQTVANHPDYDSNNTIAEGNLYSKYRSSANYDPNEVLITNNASTIDAREIDASGFIGKEGRFLTHSNRQNGNGTDFSGKYSGGCFILSSEQMEKLLSVFKEWKIPLDHNIPTKIIQIQSRLNIDYSENN